ncbi:MAG: tRNA (adenosine(37)-N6)-threonylcarbamoyltransferase complex dimerization subunit type 1 TsaB [Clostridia bacterium]
MGTMILGIDTSCEQASCAVVRDGVVLREKKRLDRKKHSETLIPLVAELLDGLGLKPGDIGLFAVSQGPGSFTGLRIGMASVKAMAYALGRRIVCVPTLDILANMHPLQDGLVLPLIDARNDQVYTALYRREGSLYRPVTEAMAIPVTGLKQMLASHGERIDTCGDAAMRHHRALGVDPPGEGMEYPSAGVCALLGQTYEKWGKSVSPEEALPFYLRVSQAERLAQT